MEVKTSIARVPFRISFFGGGTDFQHWYVDNPTSVISTSINLYSYVTVRTLLPLYDHKVRLRYYKREELQHANMIEHPTARNVLRLMKVQQGIEIVHYADLPARSGVGSSSTFSVGLIHAVANFKNIEYSRDDLASMATHVEQNMNKEIVGCQDQIAVAYGGFNQILFSRNGITVNPMNLDADIQKCFENNLLLFFVGNLRNSSEILKEQISKTDENSSNLRKISQISAESYDLFKAGELDEIGKLLNDSWKLKKGLSSQITNAKIDEAYDAAIRSGAIGGKLLGAGAGGFLLIYAAQEHHEKISSVLSSLTEVKFAFENTGSTIITMR